MKPLRILITAGPTREYFDPIRFISNSSTGILGFEMAKAAINRGHRVTLISGPTYLSPPKGAKFISVVTALEMKDAVLKNLVSCDCVIMTAAVCDWRPSKFFVNKIKRGKGSFLLKLKENPDILALAKARGRKTKRIFVGFSLETKDLVKNSYDKLRRKKLDLIVGNLIGKGKSPFGEGTKDWVIIGKDKKLAQVKSKTKTQLA
ncbi:MAG: phosphopantothenoylcysteine decarboxylase, partial [Candidatus Omnitrophota bacterium]